MSDKPGCSDEETFKIALEKTRQWCASDEHCFWDVKQKLKRYGCNSLEINRILETLAEEEFINENRYALAFASGKFNLFKWGKNKIASGMRMKNIPEQFINKALESLDEDAYRESLSKLLNKKKSGIKEGTPAEKKQKLLRFALQKGYEAELVYEILRMPDK
jgi:regulatory protein